MSMDMSTKVNMQFILECMAARYSKISLDIILS